MHGDEQRQLRAEFWQNSLGTLASRVLGLVRDMATAALLGLGTGGVMDALVIAFRLPNLLRRLFGEGALAVSFLPAFRAQYEREPAAAWKLTSVLLTWLAVALGALVVVGESVCLAVLWQSTDARTLELARLAAIMLPYLVFICVAAQLAAALQALFAFRAPALAPVLLNACWLAAVWFVAPWLPNERAQAVAIAVAVLASGVLQVAWLWPALGRLGFRFDYDWRTSRAAAVQVAKTAVPIALGLAVTQLNTLVDSLVAWGLAGEAHQSVAWLVHAVEYPLRSGAAAAIYYGERFYQLPVGLLGIAVATVYYPRFSQHAARRDRHAIAADLSLALRLVAFAAIPASVGLALVAQPATRLLFERGAFTAADSARAANMIATYGLGIWAYCALPVLVRAFYASGDRLSPAKIGLIAVSINCVLNLTLVWFLAERGLAVATAVAAAVQVVLLCRQFSRTVARTEWRDVYRTLTRAGVATSTMAAVVVLTQTMLPLAADSVRAWQALVLAVMTSLGGATYLAVAHFLRMDELGLFLLPRHKQPEAASPTRVAA
jgi:putative peptidoglycan lipid II flippase